MTQYQDLSSEPHFGHVVAKWIAGGKYSDVVLYEFHRTVNPAGIWNCENGYQDFVKLSQPYYEFILGEVDNSPEVISIAVQLGGEWLICHDCGCNYYTGNGPRGILALREACVAIKASIISRHQDMEEWLAERFGPLSGSKALQARKRESVQFEKLVKSIQSFCADLPRRKDTIGLQLKEEQLRDQMLPMLNGVFKGRCNGEARNGRGKTDILVRTKNGRKEHIFELKVWKGVKSLRDALRQVSNYLTWHNDHAGILMLVRERGFSDILIKAEEVFRMDPRVTSLHKHDKTSFRFMIKYPADPNKLITIHLELVPMS